MIVLGAASWMESPEVLRFRAARTELNDAEQELYAEIETVPAGSERAHELGGRVLAARAEFIAAWNALVRRVRREVGP